MMDVNIYKIPMSGPEDVSGLRDLIDKGDINPSEIVAVLGKTEGNGCVNDFTRGYATQSFKLYLSKVLNKSMEEIGQTIAFIMSGGTEGILSPHATVFTKKEIEGNENKESNEKSLALSVGFTKEFLPEEMGTMVMVKEVKRVVLELMESSGIKDKEDVHFVQIKTPLLTSDRINDAHSRGKKVVTHDTYESMGYTRGASALGVGLALGELKDEDVKENSILNDWSLYSNIASTSAGVELLNCEIILLGNSTKSRSKYKIGHSVMKNSIDLSAVIEAMNVAGLAVDKLPNEEQKKKIVNIFAKAETPSDGYVKGRRTTMLTDSDINHTRQARSVVGAVIAGIIGDPMIYVSGGSEHQGPDGGGPVAVIIEK
jgi:cyanuric acid amidohydrolase